MYLLVQVGVVGALHICERHTQGLDAQSRAALGYVHQPVEPRQALVVSRIRL